MQFDTGYFPHIVTDYETPPFTGTGADPTYYNYPFGSLRATVAFLELFERSLDAYALVITLEDVTDSSLIASSS